jgi:hypothetical protein
MGDQFIYNSDRRGYLGISFSILVLLLAIINPLSRNWIVGTGGQEIDETAGKHIELWERIILALIGLYLVFFVIDISDKTTIKWFCLIFLVITFGFQSIIEWKYLKDSKQFIVSLLLLLIGLIYCYLFIF